MMKTRHVIDKVLEYILIVLMGILVLDVLWQVISRYVLRSPSSFTDELARFLLIWVGILGAAFATGKKMHLAIDVLINRFNANLRMLIDSLIQAAIALFALCVMVIGGINLMLMLLKLGNRSAALSIPIGFVYSVIPISGILIIYYALSEIVTGRKQESVHRSTQ
jgi:TRAP-type C4-dicarboxylate transport system permease small subunit